MADSSHDLIFRILTQYMGEAQAAKAAADIEKLNVAAGKTSGAMRETTAATGGLATAVPNLDAKVEQFTIKTEGEYLAVLKAAEALRMNITVRQAAGVAVTNETARLASLDAALSTEAALRIAETTETKAAIAALYEHAAATEVDTAAGMDSALLGRKMVSLFDEMSRGQRGAMVSTVGSLLKNIGVGLPGMIAMLTVFAGINILITEFRKHLQGSKKDTEELDRALAEVERQMGEFDMSVWKAQKEGIDQANQAAADFEATIHKDKSALDELKGALQSQLTILREQAKAREEIVKASEQEELAAAGGDAVKEAEIRGRYARITAADEQSGRQAEMMAFQTALDVAAKEMGRAQVKFAGASGAVESQATTVAAAKINQAKALDELQLQTGMKSLEEAMGKRDEALREVAAFQHAETSGMPLPKGLQYASAEQASDVAKFIQQQIAAYQEASKVVDESTQTQKNLEKSASEAKSQLEGLRKEIDSLIEDISTKTVTNRIAEKARAKVDEITNRTAAYKIIEDYSKKEKENKVISPEEKASYATAMKVISPPAPAHKLPEVPEKPQILTPESHQQRIQDEFTHERMAAQKADREAQDAHTREMARAAEAAQKAKEASAIHAAAVARALEEQAANLQAQAQRINQLSSRSHSQLTQ